MSSDILTSRFEDPLVPPFVEYIGQESFFGGQPPLSEAVGWAVVVGFGLAFSIFTTIVVFLDKYLKGNASMTSEHFNTAGRMVKTGLTASVIVSQWTWAATLLQSSNVAWQYGVSGPFWYASGATIQILLFGVIAINLKKVAPSAHTMCEIVKARWGKGAHLTFLFFAFCANIIVTSMLLLGGAATVEALTGLNYKWASFLIPWGVILYTFAGGLKATFIASYIHTLLFSPYLSRSLPWYISRHTPLILCIISSTGPFHIVKMSANESILMIPFLRVLLLITTIKPMHADLFQEIVGTLTLPCSLEVVLCLVLSTS